MTGCAGSSIQMGKVVPGSSGEQIFHPLKSPGQPTALQASFPSYDLFLEDLSYIFKLTSSGPMLSFAHNRLQYLDRLFGLHKLVNSNQERAESKVMQSTGPRLILDVKESDKHRLSRTETFTT